MFLIVGLAAASIVLFLVFFIRRRRRNRRLEYDTAVASTLAAAGFNRTPLDGDDDENKGMRQRRRSSPSALATMSSLPSLGAQQPYSDNPAGPSTAPAREFDPYAAYGAVPPQTPPASVRRDGYVPARTSSPPLGRSHSHSHSASTSSMGHAMGHMPRESAGSTEPLLAFGGNGSQPPTPGPIAPSTSLGPPLIPPKSPKRSTGVPTDDGHVPQRDSASSVYSNDDEAGDLLVDLTPRQALEVRFCFSCVRGVLC